LFAGEYLDDSGLYYLRARFYDPDTASFLSVDPALTVSGSAYGYASGNPLQLVDPLGLFSMSGVGNWIQDHQVEIISGIAGAAVGAACLAVTAGAGSVACGALGGAVAGAVNYGMSTPVACWTAGGFFENATIGAVFGGVTAGVGEIAAPLLKSVIVSVAGKLAPAAESALGRAIAALPRIKWPSASAAESAAEAANSGSRLAEVSDSAFSAADNIGDWTVSNKHLPNAGGNYSKWAPGVDINQTVADALRSEGATFWPNSGGTADSFVVRTQMDTVVGTKGQTIVKVVVADDGRVITAYPGNWP